jgi:hypothetical protein
MTTARRGGDERHRRHESGAEPRPERERGGRAMRQADGGIRAARRAARHVLALTGREPENVVSVERDEDGWQVGVEVLELHRVPETTDILAVYEVTLDGRGELVRCQRGPRYHRSANGLG